MKKQLRRAMIGTVAMMLAAIVSLTGVTYAWFSEAKEASVDGITMDVIAVEGGVYISKSPYPESFDISVSIGKDEICQDEHNAVSTAGTLDESGKLTFYSGTLSSPTDTTLNITKVTAEDGNYFAQDIYFDNSTGGAITVTLDGTKITPDATSAKRTDLVARIAVVTHGAITIADFEAQNPYPTAKDINSVQIFEPNSTEHTPQGHTEYTNNINPEALSNAEFKYFGLDATGDDINRFSAGTQLVDMTTLKHNATTSTGDGKNVLKRDAADVEINIPAESYLKTTIYVWLEGQDADCQNNVSGAPYTAEIKFALKEGAVAGE